MGRLQWDDANLEHVARHEVGREEVEQACRIQPKVRRGRCGRYLVLGRTAEGRYLLVVLAYLGRGEARPLSARDMDGKERAIYRRK